MMSQLDQAIDQLLEIAREASGNVCTVDVDALLLVLGELTWRIETRQEGYVAQACIDGIRAMRARGELNEERLDTLLSVFAPAPLAPIPSIPTRNEAKALHGRQLDGKIPA